MVGKPGELLVIQTMPMNGPSKGPAGCARVFGPGTNARRWRAEATGGILPRSLEDKIESPVKQVKKLASITAILLCTVIAACSGQPPNPLLGKWKIIARSGDLAKYDAYCPSYMVFTNTTQTLTYAGKPATGNVTDRRRHGLT